MGRLFNFIAGGIAATAAANRLKPPTVTPITKGITIVGVEPANMTASSWRVSYILDENPNSTQSFKVTRSTTGMTIGKHRCKVFWPK